MEYFQELRERARQKIHTADHMLTITYPLVKDPKLLLAVLENIAEALDNGITAVLEHERLFKKLAPFNDHPQIKLALFKQHIGSKHPIEEKNIRMIHDINTLLHNHKKSSVEFIRKDRFVMSDNNYRLQTLDREKLKHWLSQSKSFVNQLYEMTTHHDALFG